MRRGGTRRVLAAAATITVLIGILVAATPTSAYGTTRHRQHAAFDIEGSLCPIDGTEDVGRQRHGSRVDLGGATTATIGLVSGQLTVEILARPDRRGGTLSGVGRWELRPDTSTGSLRGFVIFDRRGRASWWGRGHDALAGATVRFRTDVSTDDRGCADGLTLTGSGRAARRQPAAPVGAVQVTGTKSVADAVTDLTAAIEANPNLTLVRTVDHQAAAASRDLALGPTVELFFGNPNLGTPLMQAAQTAGIDLPQKMLIWEDLLGQTRVAYNSPGYLRSRHGIEGADAELEVIANALAALAGVAAGTEVTTTFDAGSVPKGAGLITVESTRSPEDAFAAIVAALEAAPPVNVAIVLEHDANAARVGLELDQTKLVVFGNPSLGTGLMQTGRSIALDLPQKILVTQTGDGPTLIHWNDPHWVAKRHGVAGQEAVLDTLAGALANFASQGQ